MFSWGLEPSIMAYLINHKSHWLHNYNKYITLCQSCSFPHNIFYYPVWMHSIDESLVKYRHECIISSTVQQWLPFRAVHKLCINLLLAWLIFSVQLPKAATQWEPSSGVSLKLWIKITHPMNINKLQSSCQSFYVLAIFLWGLYRKSM